ncbi:MAG: exopolyphosphatase [Alphaproteobacteria bacterium]|nr:exopolyphosphatase [Alphaproteobacteria bacterium]
MPGVLTRGGQDGRRRGPVPVAVVDIGSNSIRLVVYEGAQRAPTPVFNEKVLCGLARGLTKSGRMLESGMELALSSLARFRGLLSAMGVEQVDVVATAAVRDAENGPEFVAAVRDQCGFDVRILAGEDEARLSAMGVLSGIPEAEGLMGDLGGGSVELVRLSGRTSGDYITLPLGPLRLLDVADGRPAKGRGIIDKQLASVDWIPEAKKQHFYPVGGAWRMLARVHMAQSDYPLHVIHHYTIDAEEIVEFTKLLGKLGPKSLRKIPGISRQRIDTVPYAAYLLQRIVQVSGVSDVVFSAYGLREGCLYDRLSATVRRRDPLLSICQREAERMGRVTADGEALFHWMTPIFPDETKHQMRFRLAACYLADIGWSEHPDYRAEMVFSRILRHPAVGTDHAGRAFIALAVAARHSALPKELIEREAGWLLSEAETAQARAIGMAMRLAYTYSGGVISLLKQAALSRRDRRLTLSLPDHADILVGDVVDRRFLSLAKALSCEAEIEYYLPNGEAKISGVGD